MDGTVWQVSEWINPDSKDPVLAKASAEALKQELGWATHLSLQVSCSHRVYVLCVMCVSSALGWEHTPLARIEVARFRASATANPLLSSRTGFSKGGWTHACAVTREGCRWGGGSALPHPPTHC